jgi:hypothetical protein
VHSRFRYNFNTQCMVPLIVTWSRRTDSKAPCPTSRAVSRRQRLFLCVLFCSALVTGLEHVSEHPRAERTHECRGRTAPGVPRH